MTLQKAVLGAVFLCVGAVGCAREADAPSDSAASVEADASNEAFVVTDAHIRPLLGGRDFTSANFNIVSAQGDVLVGARSDVADIVEVHIHTMEDGMMQMRRVDGYDLPAGELVTPDALGLHLMLFGVDALEEGAAPQIVLEFESGAEKTVDFVVKTPDAAGHMEH